MPNPFHIDLLKDYVGGDVMTDPVNIKSGANALNIKASNLAGGTLRIEFRPKGSTNWYYKATGTYDAADLDADDQLWDNVLLGEGDIRANLFGTGGDATIEEVILRPTHETDIDL